jgi:predicted component of type VI protein secretion system
MGVLQGFENRLEGAVEGFFSRVFRSGLQPVELARGVQRYAADNQHVTADGVVIPNVYRISLSPKDHERLETFGESLPRELGQVVAKTASERGWVLRGPVKVRIQRQDEIRVGRFQLTGRVEVAEREPKPEAKPAQPSRLTGGSRARQVSGEVPAQPSTASPRSDDRSELDRTQVISGPPKPTLQLRVHTGESAGTNVPLQGSRVSVGRLRSCDLPLPDTTVSREHAALVRRGEKWWVVDLGSTNGTRVNGVQAAEQPIDVGDRIEFGDAVVELVEA